MKEEVFDFTGLTKQMSDNARDAGRWKGVLEVLLSLMREDHEGDYYTIDVEVINKVKKLIEQ